MAILTAFADESGTDDKSVCVSVAGFYGAKDQWQEFRRLWKPHSANFHALNSSDRFPLLCDAIESSQIHGLVITIFKAHYKQAATDHMKSFMGNPYAICAFICAMQICQQVNSLSTSFVFEQGQPNFDFVKRILDSMMDSGEFCIASVTGAKKSDFIELHPGDFVSHCASSYDKPPLQRLFDAHLLGHGHIDEAILRKIAPYVTEVVKRAKKERLKAKQGRRSTPEFQKFNSAMGTILRADPIAVKTAVDAEIKANTAEREARGELKRGRKPTSASDPASGAKD